MLYIYIYLLIIDNNSYFPEIVKTLQIVSSSQRLFGFQMLADSQILRITLLFSLTGATSK